MHEVYIIKSKHDNSYYVGEAPNAAKRLEFHNRGLQRYTKVRLPWEIVYKEQFACRHDALIREREIKNKKSRKYIEWLVKNQIAG
jgi:putative endonuclease